MLLQSGLMTGQLSSSRTSFLRVFITDTVAEKSVIYGRRRTRFIEGEKANFDAGLNCTTQRTNVTGFVSRRSLNGTTLSNPDWGNVCKLLLANQKKTHVVR